MLKATPSIALRVATFCLPAVIACSSSSGDGKADANQFGSGDSGTDTGGSTKHDSGKGGKHDGGSDASDAATPDWCAAHAPTGDQGTLCEDFDSDSLSPTLNYVGVFRQPNFSNAQYVSKPLSLWAVIPDGGVPASSYSEHPYVGVPSVGTGTFAFDLFVPGAATCNGQYIARFLASSDSNNTETDAIIVYVTLSDIVASGTTTTSYTLGLTGQVPSTGTLAAPQTITVKPQSKDGWVRVELAITDYNVASLGTATATLAWYFEGDTMPQATSSPVTANGVLAVASGTTAGVAYDVGLIAASVGDGGTVPIPAGCNIYVDNVVSVMAP